MARTPQVPPLDGMGPLGMRPPENPQPDRLRCTCLVADCMQPALLVNGQCSHHCAAHQPGAAAAVVGMTRREFVYDADHLRGIVRRLRQITEAASIEQARTWARDALDGLPGPEELKAAA